MSPIAEIREYNDRLEVIGTCGGVLIEHQKNEMSPAMLRMFDRLLNHRCVETYHGETWTPFNGGVRGQQFQSHILGRYSVERGSDGLYWYPVRGHNHSL